MVSHAQTDGANHALCFELLERLERTVFADGLRKLFAVRIVNQQQVNVVGSQLPQAVLDAAQRGFKVVAPMDRMSSSLAREHHPFAHPVERKTNSQLALTVCGRGVDVVDP